MEIQITSVNIRYMDNEPSVVNIQFQGKDLSQSINLSGFIPITSSEYVGNESLSALEGLVRAKLIERLQLTA